MQFQFGYDRPPTKPQFDPELTDLDVYMSSSHCTGVALQRGIFILPSPPSASWRRGMGQKETSQLLQESTAMTITITIVSRTSPMLPILMSGTGDNVVAAKRAAIYLARGKGIFHPIAVDSREGAMALRRAVDQHTRSLVDAGRLNGRSSLRTTRATMADRYGEN